MKISFDVRKVTVMLTDGMDLVFVDTELETSYPKFDLNPLKIKINAAKDYGVEWVKKVFGIDAEVVDTRK